MPFDKLQLYFERVTRSVLFLPFAYGILALLVLVAARVFEQLVPDSLAELVGIDATADILTILASSLLAVAIFAIGSLASALNATASAATPRARRLITGDRVAHNTIATFVGAFVFAILALVGISTGYYAGSGRVILFAFTLFVILVVIVNLISWIDQITRLGGVEDAVDKVASACAEAFAAAATAPLMGGRRLDGVPRTAFPVRQARHGFIQLIDGEALGEITETHGTELYVMLRTGDAVAPHLPVVYAGKPLDDEAIDAVRAAFVVGVRRSFEADPGYGLITLSEIASRALSPGINDPGTAIDVISSATRVLADWRDATQEADAEPRHERLHVTAIPPGNYLETAFHPIGRDGAGLLEVQTRLQSALGALARHDPEAFAVPARRLSAEALARAETAMTEQDSAEVRRAAAEAFDQTGRPSA